MADKFKFVDSSEVSGNITRIIRDMPALADMLLKQVALAIKAEAQRLAPIDTGDLRGSAVLDTSVPGEVTIAFTAPYAAAQHEHIEYHHDQGQAKYLEQPFLQIGLGDMPKELAERLLRELGS